MSKLIILTFIADHELVAQASEFFFAGYETTSSTIMYAIYELSVNKEIQNKLRQEINANIENNDEFSYDTLKEMPYLHKVVSGNAIICECKYLISN